MGAAAEPVSPPIVSPQFRRQQSLASAIAIRCCSVLCCYDCDPSFTPLPASSSLSREFTSPPSQQKQQQIAVAWRDSWRLLGSRRKDGVTQTQGGHTAEPILSNDLYARPTRWGLFFRKLRAQTRKLSHCKSSSAGFHYDALSYAMNFDEGCGSWQQQSLYRGASSLTIMETVASSEFSPSPVS